MSEKIKILFNWIGPRGPIINTEVPNLLSLSAVTEGVTTGSHHFWADDLYWRIFHKNENFSLSSTFAIEREPFIFPFTLGWRIPFGNYFCPNSGLLEFGHTPLHIIHHVRHSNGYFLLDMTAEAYITDMHLKHIHSYFSHANHIPMGKIIYLTGCMNAQEVYDTWCNQNNIPNNPNDRMKLFSFPISQHSIHTNRHLIKSPEYDTEFVPEKLFLSFNRRFRIHRTTLGLAFQKYGLLDRSYISLNKVDPENALMTFENQIHINYDDRYNFTSADVNGLLEKIPLVIDGETKINQMCQDFDSAARKFYQNSLISLVTETNFQESELTLTEKAFKPSKEKHPFIIIGVKGTLKAMREMGFKTFGEFWDESYDDVDEPRYRLWNIIQLCRQIATWDNEKILDFKRRVKPILEHNHAIVFNDTAKTLSDKLYNVIAQNNSKESS
jgi:hypothetical protein